MTVRSGYRQATLAVAILCLLGCAALAATVAAPAQAAPAARALLATATPNRPPQNVAYARVAVVRVLTYYNGTVSGDPAPIPVPSPCVADGVLVGTTGTGLNDLNYALVPTAAVNPIQPCQGAQAAFQQLNGNAASWSIGHIDVLLNAAYTGVADSQMGTIRFTIDPAQIATNGGPGAPTLLALALGTPAGAPTHDLPVLSVPQASDAPATGPSSVIDLSAYNGQPLGSDSVASGEVRTTLYPIALPAGQLSGAPRATPTSTPTAAPPEQTVTGGTAVATNQPQIPTATLSTPTPLSSQIGLGAAEIDSNGRLVGMVVADGHGNHVLAPLTDVTGRIGHVSGKSGSLMSQWQQGLASYYATPPQYPQAASAFTALASSAPDFAGVAPFKTAAQQQSPNIPSLTQPAATPTPNPTATSGSGFGLNTKAIALAAALVVIVLLALAFAVLLWRRKTAWPAPATANEAPRLDLLPPDMPLDALPPTIEREPTLPLPTVSAASGIENQPTAQLPALPPRVARVRQGMALMPHAAGLSDAGIKRAGDPNQDNILALHGMRQSGGRMQPYGLFIVADGMGGHLNGQEASRLAIEAAAKVILQPLSMSQPLSEAALVNLLRESVAQAGHELHQRNLQERADMGTTITGVLLVDDMAYVVNVGDSRTYLMSPETGLRQLTTDHSVVASLVTAGVIRPEDVYSHPRRNQIYRSLGGQQDDVEIDTFEVPLQAGDKLLLCSDGLWEMVRDPQIEHILRATADPRQAVELLVREANANGGEDNVSAIVVRLLEDVPQNAQPGMTVLIAPPASPPSVQQ